MKAAYMQVFILNESDRYSEKYFFRKNLLQNWTKPEGLRAILLFEITKMVFSTRRSKIHGLNI